MRATLLLVLVAVGGAIAFKDNCCSTEDKKEIAWIWNKVWKSTNTERKVRVMSAVVHDIIEHHPEFKDAMTAKGFTDDAHNPTARAYMIRLVHQFDNVINILEDPPVLNAQLKFMQEQYGEKEGLRSRNYFHAIAESLERVLPKAASCFPVSAWTHCLERLAEIIEHKDDDE